MNRDNLKLYAITDEYLGDEKEFLGKIEESLISGITILQLREKNLKTDEFLILALKVKKLCEKYKIPLIINDNVEVAIKCGADGIHVGQEDMKADVIRNLVGKEMILGVSAQNLEQAQIAESMGADYLGVGAIFTTSSKMDAKHVDIETLKNICENINIPVVAIGGINKENVNKLKDTKISGISVISAIFGQKDIKKSTKDLLQLVEKIID